MASIAGGATAPAADPPNVFASFKAPYTPDSIEAWSQHASAALRFRLLATANTAAGESPTAASPVGRSTASNACSDDVFVVGMYQFDESTRSRSGGLSFYSVQPPRGHPAAPSLDIREVLQHSTDAFGCLDVRWLCGGAQCCYSCCTRNNGLSLCHDEFEAPLAVIGSDCALHAYRVTGKPRSEESSSGSSLSCTHTAKIPVLSDPTRDQIGLSLDALHNQAQKAHDAEAWTIAVSPHCNGNLIATGADDCKLRLWDIRDGCRSAAAEGNFDSSRSSTESFPSLQGECTRRHSMGVTSVSFVPTSPSLLLSGRQEIFCSRGSLRGLNRFPVEGRLLLLRSMLRIPRHIACASAFGASLHSATATMLQQQQQKLQQQQQPQQQQQHQKSRRVLPFIGASVGFYDKSICCWQDAVPAVSHREHQVGAVADVHSNGGSTCCCAGSAVAASAAGAARDTVRGLGTGRL
ncbi:uncharacterized protein LOC34623708 [Cyclospora cayetanensis]|uniref:methylated diphthine methylhydrolase n=1 Tax=Cyclospora cayetanensis TaxID=88456 RepID=A0A6P6RZH8_9EIME|nr:uncharacterized protein LOC34623708 [Cyclospora cayetanensis]